MPDASIDSPSSAARFSFFATSLGTMRSQSGSMDGFGGNLGGLIGADRICQNAAAAVGAGGKTWRAFLSTYNGGTPVHAISRIGAGPWYDRNQRLVAMNVAGLLAGDRPMGDAATINDLPDENGTPLKSLGDTHDILTGSNTMGRLDGNNAAVTCNDWTDASAGTPNVVRLGHSWPAASGTHWIRAHTARGCSPGVNLVQDGPGTGTSVGAGGGWGGIYCFALTP
ncbi:MAG: hypothetical protein IPI49_22100 [Myxococcales bacterium]|nr:hypothetical protein [Myxococcales bacterium]